MKAVLTIAVSLLMSAANSAEPPLPASGDPLEQYYDQHSKEVETLAHRALDTTLSNDERAKAAIDLQARFPAVVPQLWDGWLADATAPELGQLAITDLRDHLFELHGEWQLDPSRPHVSTAVLARDKLRSLIADSSRPDLLKASLDALCTVGDPTGLAALKDAVASGHYSSAAALRHLSARPDIGAAILASIAEDSSQSMDFRRRSIAVMRGNVAYLLPLEHLARNPSTPSALRQAALESYFSVSPQTAVALAVSVSLAVTSREDKQTLVAVLASESARLEPSHSEALTLERLRDKLGSEKRSQRVSEASLRELDNAIADVRARVAYAGE